MKVQKINTSKDVQKFFEFIIYDLGINLHIDSPFSDYMWYHNNKPCFTKKEALRLQIMLEKSFQVCESEGLDIYEIALNTLQSFIKN